MRILTVVIGALAAACLAVTAANAADQPDSRSHNKQAISNLYTDTSACPGFSSTNPLLFAGTIRFAYVQWVGGEIPISEGYSDIHVSATDGSHTYSIHQRYDFPKDYLDLLLGRATTQIKRDDGATMEGYSWLGTDLDRSENLGVWWFETPTCGAPTK